MDKNLIEQTEAFMEIARQIDTLFAGKEWATFRNLLINEFSAILLQEYNSFEDYKADRRFIQRILKIGAEMQGILNNVPEAEALIKTASQTPQEEFIL